MGFAINSILYIDTYNIALLLSIMILVHVSFSQIFQEDWFGLQTLYNRGDLYTDSILGVEHTKWHGNKNVFDGYIEPFLD